MNKGYAAIPILIVMFALLIAILYIRNFSPDNQNLKNLAVAPTSTPSVFPYNTPTLPDNQSYRIILIGDSMTASLGINANSLRLSLKDLYPEKEFVTYNYSIPSSNILTVPDRLTKNMTYLGQSMPPIFNQGYDLLIFESFAYNPLSDFPIEEGLEKQEQILEETVSGLVRNRPESIIVFMTMIAPDEKNFARSRDLSDEQRKQWIKERVAYMQNHIDFAQEKNIPLINIYENSLDLPLEQKSSYISPDTIHLSDKGIEYLSNEISKYIYQKQIFPHSD